MPTSKNRSGCFFWKMLVPVPDGIAAVIATSSGCSSASAVSPSPNTWVQVGGPLAFLRASPVTGSYAARPCHFSWFASAKEKPFPFCVMTWMTRGPLIPRTNWSVSQSLVQVVAVDRAEVAEAKLLEQHARGEEILDALLHVLGEVHHALAEHAAEREGHALDLLAQPVGARVGHDAARASC